MKSNLAAFYTFLMLALWLGPQVAIAVNLHGPNCSNRAAAIARAYWSIQTSIPENSIDIPKSLTKWLESYEVGHHPQLGTLYFQNYTAKLISKDTNESVNAFVTFHSSATHPPETPHAECMLDKPTVRFSK